MASRNFGCFSDQLLAHYSHHRQTSSKGWKYHMLEMQASLFMLSSCDIQMLQNSFRFAFLSFKRTNGTHLLVPVGFYSFFEHFPLFCFPFLGMARFLRLLKSRKAIVITINQVIKQYIEHQKECFSRFPNMPWSRSRKRCVLELLLSSVVCFALFFLFSSRLFDLNTPLKDWYSF